MEKGFDSSGKKTFWNDEMKAELILVMPVFNEQASVRKVVMEWFQEIQNWTKDFFSWPSTISPGMNAEKPGPLT